jgi:TorA maturation chaperone TorD
MAAAAAPVRIQRTVPPEEAARADFYALLARLFVGGPDGPLLAALAAAEPLPREADPRLAQAWADLSRASSAMDADAGKAEYDDLFVGVGKAAVSIYAGHYIGAGAVGHPRVRLQSDLAELGLGRPAGQNEPEDHLAGLFEVMRVLAAGGAGRGPAAIADQKRFFENYLEMGAPGFFNAVIASDKANYYRKVAALGLAFMAIESEGFALE